MSVELVMLSNHLILYWCLLLLSWIFPSIRIFSNESALCIRWPKFWSFSMSISPSNEYSGLISFRFDWFDLLAVQGTHKSLLQHHNSKALILQHSVFFMVQLSDPFMITGKTTAKRSRNIFLFLIFCLFDLGFWSSQIPWNSRDDNSVFSSNETALGGPINNFMLGANH